MTDAELLENAGQITCDVKLANQPGAIWNSNTEAFRRFMKLFETEVVSPYTPSTQIGKAFYEMIKELNKDKPLRIHVREAGLEILREAYQAYFYQIYQTGHDPDTVLINRSWLGIDDGEVHVKTVRSRLNRLVEAGLVNSYTLSVYHTTEKKISENICTLFLNKEVSFFQDKEVQKYSRKLKENKPQL